MLSAFKLSMGKKYLAAQEKNMFLLKEMEKEVVIEVTLFCVAIISDISVISHLSKMIQDLSTLYSEQVAKENRKTPNESMLTLFEQLLFEALGLDRGANLHRIHLRSTASCYCLFCCSGTMTPILLDISVEIRIFLKKDILHRKGFRLISFSRSNRVSLMFGYAGMEVSVLELCWRIAILPGLFPRWTFWGFFRFTLDF